MRIERHQSLIKANIACAFIMFTFLFSSIFSAKSLRTPSNVFVMNLAFCDFMMMLKTPIFIYNSFHKGYALGHLGCQVFALVGSLSGIGAGITNACIAYDRFVNIFFIIFFSIIEVDFVVFFSFRFMKISCDR